MLRRVPMLALAVMLGCLSWGCCQASAADECMTPATGWGIFDGKWVEIGSGTCQSGSVDTLSPPQGSQSGTGSSQGSGYGAPSGCFNRDGVRVSCQAGGYWWSSAYNLWCKVADAAYRPEVTTAVWRVYGCLGRPGVHIFSAAWTNEPVDNSVGGVAVVWDR